jgi:hypothetical protein
MLKFGFHSWNSDCCAGGDQVMVCEISDNMINVSGSKSFLEMYLLVDFNCANNEASRTWSKVDV